MTTPNPYAWPYLSSSDVADTESWISGIPGHLAAGASGILTRVSDSILDRDGDLAAVAIAVRDGWSADEPQAWVRTMRHAMTVVEDYARTAASACTQLADAIGTAQTEAAEARAVADEELRQCDRALPHPLANGIDPLAPTRRAIISRLGARLGVIKDRLDTAASAFEGNVGPMPYLDFLAVIAYRDAGSAIDRNNRERMFADLRSGNFRERMFSASIEFALIDAMRQGLTPQLLSYRGNGPDGQGGIAIAIGDLSQATDVAVLVPGITNSPMDIETSIARAADLNASAMSDSTTVATTILWFDYDIPASWASDAPLRDPIAGATLAVSDSLNALGDGDAQVAGAKLAGFTSWLHQQLRPTTGISLVGFSYGSTVVSHAAQVMSPSAGVKNVVMLAAPGAGGSARSAADYAAVPPGHVYTMAIPGDPVPSSLVDDVAHMGASLAAIADMPLYDAGVIGTGHSWAEPFGADPNSPQFGAKIIDDGIDNRAIPPVAIGVHSLDIYLSGSRLDAVGDIVAGRYDEVPLR